MPIILIFLLLVGCSHSDSDVRITLNKFNDTKLERKGFNEKINSFQFLLRNSLEDMLDDINIRCSKQKDFSLDISFESPDIYKDIKEKVKLQKKSLYYKLNYTLYNGNERYNGKLKAIDSFVIPSNAYAYIISKEDSEIAGVNSLVKQLEHEIIHLLHNSCR